MTEHFNHLDRRAAGAAINRRDAALDELCRSTGRDYGDVRREMDRACGDAPGVARHQREAEWAEGRLAEASRKEHG